MGRVGRRDTNDCVSGGDVLETALAEVDDTDTYEAEGGDCHGGEYQSRRGDVRQRWQWWQRWRWWHFVVLCFDLGEDIVGCLHV